MLCDELNYFVLSVVYIQYMYLEIQIEISWALVSTLSSRFWLSWTSMAFVIVKVVPPNKLKNSSIFNFCSLQTCGGPLPVWYWDKTGWAVSWPYIILGIRRDKKMLMYLKIYVYVYLTMIWLSQCHLLANSVI